MKTKAIIIFTVALIVMAGCKETGCEDYRPYAPAEAAAKWQDYSTGQEETWDTYNSVQATLDYFGTRFKAYDSTLMQHQNVPLLLQGFLRTHENRSQVTEGFTYRIYFLVEDTMQKLDFDKSLQLASYQFPGHVVLGDADTTKRIYMKACLDITPIERLRDAYPEEERFHDPCHKYSYVINCSQITKNE